MRNIGREFIVGSWIEVQARFINLHKGKRKKNEKKKIKTITKESLYVSHVAFVNVKLNLTSKLKGKKISTHQKTVKQFAETNS